jgi:hypothetical protein
MPNGPKLPVGPNMPGGGLLWLRRPDNLLLISLWSAGYFSGSDLAKSDVPNVSPFMILLVNCFMA